MASPIGHSAAAICIYAAMRTRMLGKRVHERLANIALILATLFFSLLPDSDSAFGIWFGDFGKYHNNLTHSLFVGLGVAIVAGGLAPLLTCASYATGFLFVLLCYEIHVFMDFVTVGRGVMAFWPFTSERFQSPVKLFYGLHWSQGIYSKSHLLTLANELAFVLALVLIYRMVLRWRMNRDAVISE